MSNFYNQTQNVAGQLNRLGQNIDIDYMRDEALAVEQYRAGLEKSIKDQAEKLDYLSPKQRIDWFESTDPLNSYGGWKKSIEPTPDGDKHYTAKLQQYGKITPAIDTAFDGMHRQSKEYHFGNEVAAMTSSMMQEGRADEAKAKLDEYVSGGLLTWESGQKIWTQGQQAWALDVATRYALDAGNAGFFDGDDIDLGDPPSDPAQVDRWNQAKIRQQEAQLALSMLSYEERQKRQTDTKIDIQQREATITKARDKQWDDTFNYFSDVLIRQGDIKGGYQVYYAARDNQIFTADAQAEKMLSQLKSAEEALIKKGKEGQDKSISKQQDDFLNKVKAFTVMPAQVQSDAQILGYITQWANKSPQIVDYSVRAKAENLIKNRREADPIVAKIIPTAKIWAKKIAGDDALKADELMKQALTYYYENVTAQFNGNWSKITPEWERKTWQAATAATMEDNKIISTMLGKTQTIPANRDLYQSVNTDVMQKYFNMLKDGTLKVKTQAGDKSATDLQAEMGLTVLTIITKELSKPGAGNDRYFANNKIAPIGMSYDAGLFEDTGEPIYIIKPSLTSKYVLVDPKKELPSGVYIRLRQNGIGVYDPEKETWIPWASYCGEIDYKLSNSMIFSPGATMNSILKTGAKK